jgi:uncharacterized protein YbjT (DUF2867 family)
MDRSGKGIHVIGATGRQGSSVVRHLLKDGWHLRALAHHLDSPPWQELAEAGVQLLPGDTLDRTSLERAVEGAYGVFSMQGLSQGPEAEETQGANVADAAAAAGVKHFVYNSVEGAENEAGPPWVVSKHHIEAHIRELGIPTTIWRPVTFMENYLAQRDGILDGVLTSPLWPESMSYSIALEDIGRFVALAFREPERFIGTEMAIAGDAMPMTEVAETFARALGVPVAFSHVDVDWAPTPPRPVPGEPQHVRADIEACRALVPGLTTLAQWVALTEWKRPAAG